MSIGIPPDSAGRGGLGGTEGETLREGSTEERQSMRESRLSSGVWIERLCLLIVPGQSSRQLHTKPPDLCLQVV